MSTDEKREKMLSLVADWKASGLTQKAFSTLHGINDFIFYKSRSNRFFSVGNSAYVICCVHHVQSKREQLDDKRQSVLVGRPVLF